MTNLEKLRSLSAEELAPLLIKEKSEPEYDYDYEDNKECDKYIKKDM